MEQNGEFDLELLWGDYRDCGQVFAVQDDGSDYERDPERDVDVALTT